MAGTRYLVGPAVFGSDSGVESPGTQGIGWVGNNSSYSMAADAETGVKATQVTA